MNLIFLSPGQRVHIIAQRAAKARVRFAVVLHARVDGDPVLVATPVCGCYARCPVCRTVLGPYEYTVLGRTHLPLEMDKVPADPGAPARGLPQVVQP
jgi:hypothetical protein